MSDVQRQETISTLEAAVELTAAVWFAGALGHVAYTQRNLAGPFGWPEVAALLVVCLAVVIGEQLRVKVAGSQERAPVADGAALGLAVTGAFAYKTQLHLSAPMIILALSAATVLGCRLRSARLKQPVDGYYVAVRVHVVTIAAVGYHWIPTTVHGTAKVASVRSHGSPWWDVLVTGLIVAVAMGVGLLLSAMHLSSSTGGGLRPALKDETRTIWYLHLTTGVTAVVMALGARALGPWAYPAMVMPLVLVQVAMRRQSAIRQTKRQTVSALAQLPEIGGYTMPGHAARVAELAVGIGRELRLTERELLELEHAAQLHDVGQVGLRIPLPAGATVEAAPGDQQAIASHGARILAEAGDGSSILAIVEHQAVRYRQVTELGSGAIPLSARILKVANAFDDFSHGRRDARFREAAIERISLGLGYEYDPQVFQALLAVVESPAARLSARR